jgi:ATP-dependent exoDNAse (exonuclease V) beta subunit
MNSAPTLKILKASAGSGKTYALVMQYLTLALQQKQTDYYQRILAITFTNAAAAEMKERVLTRLKELASQKAEQHLTEELCKSCGLNAEELSERASAVLKHMLHHYGKLSILTIDSFTHRLVRSFSRDLRLTSDFKIEIQSSAFHELLADACLDQIGRDSILTDYMTHFAVQNEEEGGSWQFRNSLIDNARLIENENSERPMKNLSHLGYDEAKALREKITKEFNDDCARLQGMVKYLWGLMEDHDLVPENFSHGKKIFAPFQRQITTPVIKLSTLFEKLPFEPYWGTQKTPVDIRAKLTAFQAESIDLIRAIIEHNNPRNTAIVKLKSTIKSSVFGLGLLQYMHEKAGEIKQEENLVLISDLHKMVREVIEDSHAPFIYERIGNRYNHILFDEFQDTSELQWYNTIPLMHNSLAAGHSSLIVGDAKQAIYRWRGGSSEQLIQLPELMGKYKNSDAERIFGAASDVDDLLDNRRSCAAIIRFNNRLFELMKPTLGNLERVYHKHKQNTNRVEEGYVEAIAIDMRDDETKADVRNRTMQKIVDIIQECEALGYRKGQIAILVRKGKDGGEIARMLTDLKIPVTTRESFRAEHSPAVRALVHYLGISLKIDLSINGMFFAEAMCEIRQTSLTDCVQRNAENINGKLHPDYVKLLNDLGDSGEMISPDGNIFDFFKKVMCRFSIPHDSGVDFLFDTVRQRCVGANHSLNEFLQWWNDEKSRLYITEQKDPDAVQITTIHKSKGLQYPVVIYPRFATAPPRDSKIWLDIPEAEFGIPNIQATPTSALEDIDELKPALEMEADYAALDQLNTFYVATTRPEDRLYIIQETSCKLAESANFIKTLETEYPTFKEDRVWREGVNTRKTEGASNTSESEKSTIIFSSENAEGALRLKKLKGEETEEQRDGIIFHYCISLIRSENDIHNALNNTFRKYNVHDINERSKLENHIYNIVNDSPSKDWFRADSKQYNERELCLTDGNIIRPDRVIELENEMLVIDFKTGKERDSHKKQIQTYLNAMTQITSKPIRGILYYIQQKRHVEFA